MSGTVNYIIRNGKALYKGKIATLDSMAIIDGRMHFEVGERNGSPLLVFTGSRSNMKEINAASMIVSPGFVDGHIHGFGGYGVMDATADSLEGMAQTLASYGCTHFFPTTLAAPREKVKEALYTIAEAQKAQKGTPKAKICGAHLEGTFISRERPGAQNPDYFELPAKEVLDDLMEASSNVIRLMTIAPELEGALPFMQYAVSHYGIQMSFGHSTSTYKEARNAMEELQELPNCPKIRVTHTYNAMETNHKDTGLVGIASNIPHVGAEIIMDRIHVQDQQMRILKRAKTSRGYTPNIHIITDAMPPAGTRGEVNFTLGGKRVYEKETEFGTALYLDEECTILAGSHLSMDQGVRNAVDIGFTVAEALTMATRIPANSLRIGDEAGSLKNGRPADLVLLNSRDLEVICTMVDGRKIDVPDQK